MKTIRTLLKELLKPPSKTTKNTPGNSQSLSVVNPNKNEASCEEESDNKNTNNTNNSNANETETNEDPGDNRLDTAGGQKITASIEEKPGITGEPRGESGNEPERESGGESGGSRVEPKAEKDIEERIREAYEKGIIEGRNQQIEEKFFPKYDGIPEFRGAHSLKSTSEDIFSIAREA